MSTTKQRTRQTLADSLRAKTVSAKKSGAARKVAKLTTKEYSKVLFNQCVSEANQAADKGESEAWVWVRRGSRIAGFVERWDLAKYTEELLVKAGFNVETGIIPSDKADDPRLKGTPVFLFISWKK